MQGTVRQASDAPRCGAGSEVQPVGPQPASGRGGRGQQDRPKGLRGRAVIRARERLPSGAPRRQS
eukprot:550826-Lingulodinium_polyedra.AAC.1